MNIYSILQLAQELIQKPSISPDDHGCQTILIERLKKLNFSIEVMYFKDTTNLWALHGEDKRKTLVFAGHTDVVPAGDQKNWNFPPFQPTLNNGFLYGRGAADMKGSLAAMIIAAEKFIKNFPSHPGRLAFLITSDEEDKATNGTVKVINTLIKRNETINYCIVGEPSSTKKIGDTIKNGRRGSLNITLIIKGEQGHIAYPNSINNPILIALPFLSELVKKKWDTGNIFFPPTSMQIANIYSDIQSNNTTPSKLVIKFNFRFSNELTAKKIKQKIEKILKKYQLNYKLYCSLSANPFLTKGGELINIVCKVIEKHCGYYPKLSTDGGTSDARFIIDIGAQVIELGPLNKSIHKANECISVKDLQKLSFIYYKIAKKILLN
ncbi:succinyl-diaminopimelate desuccinylase [Arsenophonus symbiont of Ornithomya chloropus]|uniref:succinyl-diaminopimelate desuccinylase n=1 Tax=Arsenophonus symbiont of Ornithomya chloropus TaxID=634121 RepID=UPI0032B17384